MAYFPIFSCYLCLISNYYISLAVSSSIKTETPSRDHGEIAVSPRPGNLLFDSMFVLRLSFHVLVMLIHGKKFESWTFLGIFLKSLYFPSLL